MYEKEVIEQEAKIESMKQSGADEYNIKKQMEVLLESRNMIPDITRKLRISSDELSSILETEKDLSEKEEYKIASELVKNITI